MSKLKSELETELNDMLRDRNKCRDARDALKTQIAQALELIALVGDCRIEQNKTDLLELVENVLGN